jgi:hypothetical protein
MALRQDAQPAGIEDDGGYRSLGWRLEPPPWILGEKRFDLRVVLLRLQ